MLWWLATSRRWTGRLPINVYAIQHDDGLVVFDTGQDRRSVTDPDYFPGGLAGWAFRRLARFGIGAGDTLPAQLTGIGLSADHVAVAVISHLHQDHIGGIRDLPNARLLADHRELDTLDASHPELTGVLVQHLTGPGITWEPVRADQPLDAWFAPFETGFDVFGDGTLTLVSTPGHTPGSLSMIVRRAGLPPLMLVGDLSYDVSGIDELTIPGVGERDALRESMRRVAALRARHPELVILAAHDPNAATLLAEANAR
jgi:glyoxylase-like metal-dependent hydrolase (beta-lactamase superfamily II)